MSSGLATTLRLLTKTPNDAAVRVLIPALDSPHPAIQEGALVALLTRHSGAGHREILRRLPAIPQRWKDLIRQHNADMSRTLREAALGSDLQMCQNACQAAVCFRQYDLVPVLLNALDGPVRPNTDQVARTLLELVEQLYEELAAGRDNARRDPQLIRRHLISSLETSVGRFVRHHRHEVVEAFLLLVTRDNILLQRILQDPHHPVFPMLVHTLSHGPRGGVMRLLLSFLDDPHVPSAALSVIANRSDLKFVQYLLRKIGREPSGVVRQNLKRIESVAWLHAGASLLDQLDDAGQMAAVRLAVESGTARLQLFPAVEYLLLHGKLGGRREAANALAEFHGAEANALALRALEDPDPQVQANVIVQLRRRGIPAVLPRLVELLDSPQAMVRKAARQSLTEFTFRRYAASFDMLDDDVRRSTGLLVKKVDLQTLPRLREEMTSPVRSRRHRAVAMARVMDAVPPLEQVIVDLLQDEDHLVRVEAAAALERGTSPTSYLALEEALGDRSPAVQDAAARSLSARTPLGFRQEDASPIM